MRKIRFEELDTEVLMRVCRETSEEVSRMAGYKYSIMKAYEVLICSKVPYAENGNIAPGSYEEVE